MLWKSKSEPSNVNDTLASRPLGGHNTPLSGPVIIPSCNAVIR